MTRADLSKEIVEALVKQHGTKSQAARAIAPEFKTEMGKPAALKTIRMLFDDILCGALVPNILDADSEKLNHLRKLIEDMGVPVESIGKVRRARLYQGYIKNKEGEVEKTNLASLVLDPAWKEGPKYPVIQPATPAIIKFERRKPVSSNIEMVIVYPDTQFGYRRSGTSVRDDIETSRLLPIHDERALDVALQITADIRPHRAYGVGDLFDFTEFTLKYPQRVNFQRTTQAAIDRAARWLDERKAAAGPQLEIVEEVPGNHDRRMPEYLEQLARGAFGIQPAGATPSSFPPFTVPWALNFDKRKIAYHQQYPAGTAWIIPSKRGKPGLAIRHAPTAMADWFASIINGHDHKLQLTCQTVQTHEGRFVLKRISAGCLCRVDLVKDPNDLTPMAVPSDKGYAKWQQGLVVVSIDRKTKQWHAELVEIEDGRAMYQGRLYVSSRRAA